MTWLRSWCACSCISSWAGRRCTFCSSSCIPQPLVCGPWSWTTPAGSYVIIYLLDFVPVAVEFPVVRDLGAHPLKVLRVRARAEPSGAEIGIAVWILAWEVNHLRVDQKLSLVGRTRERLRILDITLVLVPVALVLLRLRRVVLEMIHALTGNQLSPSNELLVLKVRIRIRRNIFSATIGYFLNDWFIFLVLSTDREEILFQNLQFSWVLSQKLFEQPHLFVH